MSNLKTGRSEVAQDGRAAKGQEKGRVIRNQSPAHARPIRRWLPKRRYGDICATARLEPDAATQHLAAMLTRRALLAALLPTPLAAQEFISVDRVLSDEAFYKLVACAAPPGGSCSKPLIYWPAPRRLALRIGIAEIDPAFPSYKFDLVDRAIDDAISEINGVGADLLLERRYGAPFDVAIYLTNAPEGGTIEGTGNSQIDGSDIAIGRVVLRSRGSDIVEGTIAISLDISRREIASVVLEELVQAMGLLTDIEGAAYQRSIFSETSNSTVRLTGQDAEALRRHYPRR